jgi:hypothetical protein
VTSKLSCHRGHSFLPLRESDQQLGLLIGPFAVARSIAVLAPWIESCISWGCNSGAMKADDLHPVTRSPDKIHHGYGR